MKARHLMSYKDIHGEWRIATGEYPVTLEVAKKYAKDFAESKVYRLVEVRTKRKK